MKFPNDMDANSESDESNMKNKKLTSFLALWFVCVTGFGDDEEITRKTKPNVFPFPDPPEYREVERFNSSVILNTTDIVIGEIEQFSTTDRFTSDLEQYDGGELNIATLVVETFVGGKNRKSMQEIGENRLLLASALGEELPEIEGEISILNPIDPRKDPLFDIPEMNRSIRFLRKLSEEEIEELKESLTLTYRWLTGESVVAQMTSDGKKIGERVYDNDARPIRIPSDLWVWAKDGNDRRWSSQLLGENPGDPLPVWNNPYKGSGVTVTKPLGLTHFLERKAKVEATETAIVSYLSDLMLWLQEIRSEAEEIDKETLDPLQKELYKKLQKRDP